MEVHVPDDAAVSRDLVQSPVHVALDPPGEDGAPPDDEKKDDEESGPGPAAPTARNGAMRFFRHESSLSTAWMGRRRSAGPVWRPLEEDGRVPAKRRPARPASDGRFFANEKPPTSSFHFRESETPGVEVLLFYKTGRRRGRAERGRRFRARGASDLF
jgi:hypothetical protein